MRTARHTGTSTPLATAAWLPLIMKHSAGGTRGRTCGQPGTTRNTFGPMDSMPTSDHQARWPDRRRSMLLETICQANFKQNRQRVTAVMRQS